MNNVILIGFMGAGKTTIGEGVAAACGMKLVDTDRMIEEMAGMTIADIFAEKGEMEFRRTESAVLKKLLLESEGAVISVGGGLPLKEENRQMLKRLGTVVYLEVSPDTVLERLKGDTTRPLLMGDNVKERVRNLIAQRDPLYRKAANVIVNVDGRGIEEILEELNERTGVRG